VSIGVDTLRLGIRPGTPNIRLPDWGSWKVQERPRCMVYAPGEADQSFQARLNAQDLTTGIRIEQSEDGRGWLEGSLPKFVHQTAQNGLPVAPGEVVEAACALARSFGLDDPRMLPVRRLDVAGDWQGPVSPWRASAMGWKWSASRSIPQADLWSVTIGRHGHNQLCMYDKGQESGKEPDRHGRCEVRSWKGHGFGSVAALSDVQAWWVQQVRKLDGQAPPELSGSAIAQALVFCAMKHPDQVAQVEIILRNQGSVSTVARFRRFLRQAQRSAHRLGDDLVQLCLAA
jgi:hypothetical protein